MEIFAWKEEKPQYYQDHIKGMIECWENYLKKKYIKSMKRVLEIKNDGIIDFIIKYMLIFHDSGKCTEYYQQNIGNTQRYRHEIMSSYLSYKILEGVVDEYLQCLVSGAILLHHEPMLMGSISYQRERGVTLTDIRGRIEYPLIGESRKIETTKILHKDFKKLFKYLINEHLKNYKNHEKVLYNLENLNLKLDIEDIIKTIGRFVSILSLVGDDVWRHKMRFKVSSLQYIIIVSDYYGSKDRGEKEFSFTNEIKWEWGEF